MNSVCLIGRLTRDPELRTFDSGDALCSFTLAVNIIKDKTAFIPIQVYGEKANLMAKTLRKGHQISVQGRLDQDTYTNQNNEKKTVTYVKLDSFDYLEKKETETAQNEQTTENTEYQKTAKEIAKNLKSSYTPDDISQMDLPDDLPFWRKYHTILTKES